MWKSKRHQATLSHLTHRQVLGSTLLKRDIRATSGLPRFVEKPVEIDSESDAQGWSTLACGGED
jgi:hypothetical protein